MKLRKMEFGGFRTFAEPTKFDFGTTPGLYFLEGGENRVDPSLGSNGVGKSTVWSALCWILFGKTADGLKAGDLKSWQSRDKGYYGKLWIGRHLVHRTWKPNNLTIDGEVVEQTALEDRLRISFDTFTSSVVLAQGSEMFFDLSPARKLSLFTSMLQLDNWIDYSSMAKARADSLRDSIHSVERDISKIEGMLAGLGLEDLRFARKKWRSHRTKRIREIRREARGVRAQSEKNQQLLKNIKSTAKTIQIKLQKADAESKAVSDKLTECKHTVEKLQWQADMQHDQMYALEGQIVKAQEHKEGECELCGQPIDKKHLKAHVKNLTRKLRKVQSSANQTTASMREARAEQSELDSEYKALLKRASKLNKRLSDADQSIEELIEVCALSEASVMSMDDRVSAIHKEKNPYIPLQTEKEIEEERLLRELDVCKKKLRRKEARCKDYTYWVQGFKDVRLFLIEEALQQLQLETNRALADLGFSSDWYVHYSVDRKTKSGGSVSGFDVSITSPHSKEKVPFAAWSGGERQRLKIAGSIGFIALMSARTGQDFGIEVYDEPTQHLSPQGIDSLLETLRQRALDSGKRIWLVDHHTLDYGDFTGRAVVDKDEEGSKLWQS